MNIFAIEESLAALHIKYRKIEFDFSNILFFCETSNHTTFDLEIDTDEDSLLLWRLIQTNNIPSGKVTTIKYNMSGLSIGFQLSEDDLKIFSNQSLRGIHEEDIQQKTTHQIAAFLKVNLKASGMFAK